MGLLIERGTDVVVNSCRFQNNKSTDIGGSIFNRGSLVVTDTTFDNNEGQVSCFLFLFFLILYKK